MAKWLNGDIASWVVAEETLTLFQVRLIDKSLAHDHFCHFTILPWNAFGRRQMINSFV